MHDDSATPFATLDHHGWRVTFAANGMVATMSDGAHSWGEGPEARPLVVEVGGDRIALVSPRRDEAGPGEVVSVFDLGEPHGLVVRVRQRLLDVAGGSGVGVATTVELTPSHAVPQDVTVRLPAAISVGTDPEWFAPLKNGVGYSGQGGYPYGQFTWQLGGGVRRGLGGYAVPLGLPLVSQLDHASGQRVTWCADPYFTVSFQLEEPDPELNWRYLAGAPMTEPESHTIVTCLHRGDAREAIDAFYATALADVPPGPEWLHDVALTHYDYFSDRGTGWFRDIDALAEMIAEPDRARVCVCLHGWYDRLGAYSMDAATRALRTSWRLVRRPEASSAGGLDVTLDDVLGMLRYARDRGFRVALYYGYGLTAESSWARDTFEQAAILRCAGWDEGPDATAMLNPLHPDVHRWYLDYTAALMAAFGDDIDALVWDDTAFIPYGELGSPAFPGYADRAFMRLMRDIGAAAHAHRPDIALLGSDLVGHLYSADGTGRDTVGYSIVADGCWQDSSCLPDAWGFALFPNFRNVMWSCNWWPTRNVELTHYGVWNFGTPAATSNGYGDDRGPSEYTAAERATLMSLFLDRPQLPHVMSWIPPGDPRTPQPFGARRAPRLAKDHDGNPLFYPV